MAPFASWRRLSQAGLDLPRSLEIDRRAEVNGLPAQLLSRDDSSGPSQEMDNGTLPKWAQYLILIAASLLLLAIVAGIFWCRGKQCPSRKRKSTLKPLKITSPMSEKRSKAASLPQIRIDPPQTSADITVTVATASSESSMVEVQPPPPGRLHRGSDPSSPHLSSPENSTHVPPHAISQASVLPSFYTVSGERPLRPDSGGDPFADPSSDDSDDAGDLSLVPLSPHFPPGKSAGNSAVVHGDR